MRVSRRDLLRSRSAVSFSVAVAITVALAAPAPAITRSLTSLTAIEDEVMCVLCHTPLAVSESPQANSERDYIRSRIARGETKRQILQDLVVQYGEAVLAKPRAQGFNLVIWVLPPAAVLGALAALAVALPRWRRRARATQAVRAQHPCGAPAPLDEADAARLETELARFEG